MEQFLESVGPFGRYQRRNFLLLSLPTIVVAMQKFAWVFLGAKVNHRCRLPWEDSASEFHLKEEEMALYYPKDPRGNGYSQCQIYSNAWNETASLTSRGETETEREVVGCSTFVYDTTEYKTSAVIDYDLVCSRAWMRATVQSVFMVGMLVGSYLFGDISDRVGRKPVFLTALCLMVVLGVAQVSVLNYELFVATRLLLGVSLQGTFLTAYVLMLEIVGKSKRVVVGILAQVFYSFAFFVGAGLAFWITSWRWLQVAYTVPALLFTPYYWIIDESARWLNTKGRTEEARVILQKVAKTNIKKAEASEDLVQQALQSLPGESSGNFLDLFRKRSLRFKTLNFFFNWAVNSGVYYGLSLNTGNLGGNDYLNFLISGAVEIPALLLSVLVVEKIGRRVPLCCLMVSGGLALLSGIFIRPGSVVLTVVTMVGKLCITASYAIVYIFTAESFPTVVRNVAIGGASMIARIGGALAPYVNLLEVYWAPFPYVVFGGLSVLAGLLSLALDETKDRPLPDFIGENSREESREDIKRDCREDYREDCREECKNEDSSVSPHSAANVYFVPSPSGPADLTLSPNDSKI